LTGPAQNRRYSPAIGRLESTLSGRSVKTVDIAVGS
jgi:hypothetical protein